MAATSSSVHSPTALSINIDSTSSEASEIQVDSDLINPLLYDFVTAAQKV